MIQRKKRVIYLCIFLSMFIIGTILILNIPFNIKITYNLTTITEDGTQIVFNVYEPKVPEPNRKAVIIGHGGMASKEFMKSYAIEIACAGFIVVAFDFRGHGQSSGEYSFDLVVNEIKAIKQYLISRSDVDIHNLTYIGYSVGGYPGVQIVKNDIDFKSFIGIGTGLPTSDYLPNCTVLSNSGRKLNILIIQAKFDEAISLDRLREGMALRLNTTADNVDLNKLYGSFQDNNASMIFLDDNSDHLLLCWDETFIRMARDWTINTFPDVKAVDENFYVNLRKVILLLQIIGGIGFFFLLIEPLSEMIVPPKEEFIKRIELSHESINSLSKKYILYSLFLGIPGMAIMLPVLIFLPLTIAGVILALLFGQGFSSIILLWRSGKKANLSIIKIIKRPFEIPKIRLLKEICLGIILTIILYIIIFLSFGLNYIGFVPGISKLPWIPIYYAIGMFLMLIYSILFQLVLLQKFKNGIKEQIKAILLIFTLLMIYICTFIIVPCIIINNYFIVIFLYIITPIIILVASISVVLYKKTGNIISASIINTTIIISLACTLAPYINVLNVLLTGQPFVISM
ncbi:MAG: alpha/beta hydrolase [Candidatus Helarchaeota archaeon]